MIDSVQALRAAEHSAIAAQIEAFEAAGGTIERLPIGASRDAALTARQRINPDVRTRAMIEAQERAARAATKRGIPAPRPARPRRDRLPKPPKLARPGTQKARILVELLAGPVSAKFLAGLLGTSRNTTLMQLYDLRERVLAYDEGAHHSMRWHLTAEGRRLARSLARETEPERVAA